MSNNTTSDTGRQRRLFKKRRAGIVLTRGEVKEIIAGRKKIRREMRERKIYSRREFEATASSLGLYFDKGRFLAFWLWLWHRGALAALLVALSLALLAMYGFSTVTELRGHFTINLADSLVNQGFELSDTSDFANPTSRLYGQVVEDAPCISIANLPADVDHIDGSHNGRNYFAHTFYIAKRGEGTVDVQVSLVINSESRAASKAIWAVLYQDGQPTVYARANLATGQEECLPGAADNRRGYTNIPCLDMQNHPQLQVIRQSAGRNYYRLTPRSFVSEEVVTTFTLTNVAPDEVHKYTVVLWLEGDDPDCTDELIGGHVGMHMDFELLE